MVEYSAISQESELGDLQHKKYVDGLSYYGQFKGDII